MIRRIIHIDQDKCIQCGACAEGCVTGALSIIPWDKIAAASQEI